ncbi:MAG: divalent-cation tolerance protein CutA [Acidobacteriota bacterium]
MGEILVLSTADSMELAVKIARTIVDESRAACVNIVPGVRSIYRWDGKLCDDSELLLLIKTSEENYKKVNSSIRNLHTYDTPEVISIPITAGDPEYLHWLRNQVHPRSD